MSSLALQAGLMLGSQALASKSGASDVATLMMSGVNGSSLGSSLGPLAQSGVNSVINAVNNSKVIRKSLRKTGKKLKKAFSSIGGKKSKLRKSKVDAVMKKAVNDAQVVMSSVGGIISSKFDEVQESSNRAYRMAESFVGNSEFDVSNHIDLVANSMDSAASCLEANINRLVEEVSSMTGKSVLEFKKQSDALKASDLRMAWNRLSDASRAVARNLEVSNVSGVLMRERVKTIKGKLSRAFNKGVVKPVRAACGNFVAKIQNDTENTLLEVRNPVSNTEDSDSFHASKLLSGLVQAPKPFGTQGPIFNMQGLTYGPLNYSGTMTYTVVDGNISTITNPYYNGGCPQFTVDSGRVLESEIRCEVATLFRRTANTALTTDTVFGLSPLRVGAYLDGGYVKSMSDFKSALEEVARPVPDFYRCPADIMAKWGATKGDRLGVGWQLARYGDDPGSYAISSFGLFNPTDGECAYLNSHVGQFGSEAGTGTYDRVTGSRAVLNDVLRDYGYLGCHRFWNVPYYAGAPYTTNPFRNEINPRLKYCSENWTYSGRVRVFIPYTDPVIVAKNLGGLNTLPDLLSQYTYESYYGDIISALPTFRFATGRASSGTYTGEGSLNPITFDRIESLDAGNSFVVICRMINGSEVFEAKFTNFSRSANGFNFDYLVEGTCRIEDPTEYPAVCIEMIRPRPKVMPVLTSSNRMLIFPEFRWINNTCLSPVKSAPISCFVGGRWFNCRDSPTALLMSICRSYDAPNEVPVSTLGSWVRHLFSTHQRGAFLLMSRIMKSPEYLQLSGLRKVLSKVYFEGGVMKCSLDYNEKCFPLLSFELVNSIGFLDSSRRILPKSSTGYFDLTPWREDQFSLSDLVFLRHPMTQLSEIIKLIFSDWRSDPLKHLVKYIQIGVIGTRCLQELFISGVSSESFSGESDIHDVMYVSLAQTITTCTRADCSLMSNQMKSDWGAFVHTVSSLMGVNRIIPEASLSVIAINPLTLVPDAVEIEDENPQFNSLLDQNITG